MSRRIRRRPLAEFKAKWLYSTSARRPDTFGVASQFDVHPNQSFAHMEGPVAGSGGRSYLAPGEGRLKSR